VRLRGGSRIQGFWHGPELSDIHLACLKSFSNAGHEFIIYAYENLKVPCGIHLEDASEIVPISEAFDGFDIIIDDCAHIGSIAKSSFWYLFDNPPEARWPLFH
jgi:hypothetical protein